jgi:membrane associated rhomboid family serine protease
MAGIFGDIKNNFNQGNVVVKIIFINAAVFLLTIIVGLFYKPLHVSSTPLVKILIASSDVSKLLFKPWSIITYTFLHYNIWHILFNMIFLYSGGRIFIEFLGEKRFISTYILGGISGFFLFLIVFNLVPAFNSFEGELLGASASVLAVFIAVATYLPNYEVGLVLIGPVKLKYIAIFLVILDFLQIESGSNAGGHIAHLGGVLFGYLSSKGLQNGIDVSEYFYKPIDAIKFRFSREPKSKIKVAYRREEQKPKVDPREKRNQEKIDEILDKISKSGYDSLSKEDKDYLFNSNKN